MKQFDAVKSTYGAPMGRPSYVNEKEARVRVFRVRFVDGDYDDGGAYWGGGQGLYCARDKRIDPDVQVFVRADSLEEAVNEIHIDYPGLRFYGRDFATKS